MFQGLADLCCLRNLFWDLFGTVLNKDRTALTTNWRRVIMTGKGAWVVENIRVFQYGRIIGRDRERFSGWTPIPSSRVWPSTLALQSTDDLPQGSINQFARELWVSL